MAEDPQLTNEYAIETEALDIYYGNFRAVKETTLKIEQKKIKPRQGFDLPSESDLLFRRETGIVHAGRGGELRYGLVFHPHPRKRLKLVEYPVPSFKRISACRDMLDQPVDAFAPRLRSLEK